MKLPRKSTPPRPFLRRPTTWLNALLLCGLAIFWIFFRPLPTVGGGQLDGWEATALKERVYASVSPEDALGFERIDPARPGGWLLAFRETPQSLETYQAQNLIRPTEARRTLVLQPIGAMSAPDARLLEELRRYAAIYFQLPARIAPAVGLPPSSDGMLRGNQYDAGRIMGEVLQPRVPPDAAIYFGLTNADLWRPDLNFVFGVGDNSSGVGILSLARLRPSFWHRKPEKSDDALILMRAARVLSHEIGHVLGMWHCVFYKCVMNGSNSLQESDAQPLQLCPVCHRKLLWNASADGARRYSEMLRFYREHKFDAEAKWQEARLERWKRIAGREELR